MSDAEFKATVNGVQKGNHWWPFVVEFAEPVHVVQEIYCLEDSQDAASGIRAGEHQPDAVRLAGVHCPLGCPSGPCGDLR
jgi:hypothetical protein